MLRPAHAWRSPSHFQSFVSTSAGGEVRPRRVARSTAGARARHLAFEAADLAAHIDESVMRAFEGNPVDAFRIAMVAGAGIGVQIDEAEYALLVCSGATLRADRAAPTLVAYRVLQGIGVGADPVTAAQWFRMGADLGDPKRDDRVGIAVRDGKGVAAESLDCCALVDAGRWSPMVERPWETPTPADWESSRI